MSAISNFLEDKWLRMLSSAQAYTAPQTWVSLHTADPTDAGTGAEVSGGAYARQRVFQDGATPPFWNTPVDDSGPQLVDNNGNISFPTATATWGTVTHVAIWDASSGGNLLYHGALAASKPISGGDSFKFNSGELNVRLG